MDGSLRWCVSSPFWHLDAVRGPSTPSFDDLVGAGEERGRYGEAERLRGLQVQDHLHLYRLLHGHIGRLFAFQYPGDVGPLQAVRGGRAVSIADETAAGGELRVSRYCRNGMTRSQCGDPIEPA